MRRREFLALAGAVAAFPRVALGQQLPKVSRIAYLSLVEGPEQLAALRDGLAEAGYINGKECKRRGLHRACNWRPACARRPSCGQSPDVLVTQGPQPPWLQRE
jgi:hypothetical protein